MARNKWRFKEGDRVTWSGGNGQRKTGEVLEQCLWSLPHRNTRATYWIKYDERGKTHKMYVDEENLIRAESIYEMKRL